MGEYTRYFAVPGLQPGHLDTWVAMDTKGHKNVMITVRYNEFRYISVYHLTWDDTPTTQTSENLLDFVEQS